MKFEKAAQISMRNHPELNEKWLQGKLADDPSLLGLGDLEVKDLERRQPGAGRLDMLLTDPETQARYEVEIQLGATDETHIVRTIEYWDIEKSRYPQYEHVAVIVAEDITSRFLNVISLFNKALPLVAIQMKALSIGGVLTLQATTVLDQMPLGTDEEDDAGQATDRNYWIKKGSDETVGLADRMLGIVREVTDEDLILKYNKHYIGLSRGGVVNNYVVFLPRKDFLIAEFRIKRSDEVTTLIEDSGLDALAYDKHWGRYRLRLRAQEIRESSEFLKLLVQHAHGTPPLIES